MSRDALTADEVERLNGLRARHQQSVQESHRQRKIAEDAETAANKLWNEGVEISRQISELIYGLSYGPKRARVGD